jgi:hypothetical protein
MFYVFQWFSDGPMQQVSEGFIKYDNAVLEAKLKASNMDGIYHVMQDKCLVHTEKVVKVHKQ